MKESKQIKVKKKYWENLSLISSVKIVAQEQKWFSYKKTCSMSNITLIVSLPQEQQSLEQGLTHKMMAARLHLHSFFL